MIKARTENLGILEAIRELRRMSMNNPLRLRYEAYLKRVRDEKAREGYVWDQGQAKGREEGKIEGEKLMAALTERLLAITGWRTQSWRPETRRRGNGFTGNME